MLNLTAHPQGVVLPVKARPGARRNAVDGPRNGELLVSVTQAAEKGKANAAVAKLLAKELGVRLTDIQLLSGAAGPRKRFLIAGVELAAVRDKLANP